MKAFRDNLALILVAIIAIVLVFLMVRLQSLIMTTPEPTPAAQSTPEVLQPQQPAVVVQPTATTAAVPTDTPVAAQPPALPTATTGGYTVYGSEVIGAIHVGAITDRGYNQAHHDGLQQMIQQVPGVRLLEAENIPETEAVLPVIDQMVQQGAKIIFVQSFGYLPFAIQAAERYPDVVFLHPGGFELRGNLGTYWANNFEAMYLAGVAAGAATKTNQLGFITAFPIPNILASANAFHLGARSVNPNVTTKLVINESWVDPTKENIATRALAASGVDVVTMIVDSPITVVQTAEALGIYVIGFHSDALQELAPNGWLTGVAYTWGNYYTNVVQQIRAGQWQSAHVRGGIESGALRALATTGPSRTAWLPNVPTVKEAGVSDYEVTGWNALYAPKGTPAPVVETIGKALREVIANPDMRKRLLDLGVEPRTSSSAEMADIFERDRRKWAQVIQLAKLKV